MRRFRLLFLVVAVVLLVPMALLVRRALQSVDVERRMRHQAVAERLFDEMERALSEILAREEERPFGQYSFSYTAPDRHGAVVRSPLAEPPGVPFIIGYFQIDPDGSLHTPLQPRAANDEGVAPDWQPSAAASAAIAQIEQIVGPYWRSDRSVGDIPPAATPQLPGSTIELSRDVGGAPELPGTRSELAAASRGSAYDALRALNKGVEQRAERQARAWRGIGPSVSDERASGDVRERAFANRLGSDMLEPKDAPANTGQAREATHVELSPLIGRVIDSRHLLLYRTVVHDTQGYRQGLLIDLDTLGAWLRQQALGSSELAAYASLVFGSTMTPLPNTASDLVYQHRFAEPFDGVHARLVLTPLPGVGGAAYMYALATLLLVATLLGLAALYRMVSVVVRYAEQRNNFVAAVTHELKTPLTAIRLYGEMLRDGLVASESKRDEYHRHITAESERLTRLVNNVLELSRLETRAPQIDAVTAPLGPVVQEVAELVRPHVEGEGFRLRVDVEPELPPVRFERDALMQVLFNLVDNAVKYANGVAPKEITLRCRRDAGDVRLAVRDHGPGVAAHHLRKIFLPFYRAESELTRRSKGTGLGLALVRGLGERMGARVIGRNVPEGGFEVEIIFRPDAPVSRPG